MFDAISTGAESDIEQLTGLARQMVGRWGMSSTVGPVAVISRDGSGPFLPGTSEVSPETQRLLDDEVRRIVADAHEEVLALLRENRQRLDSLAQALLEHETLDEDDAYAAAGVTRPPPPSPSSSRQPLARGRRGSGRTAASRLRDPLQDLARWVETACAGTIGRPPPSTSGLGHHPFKVATRVRIPLGASHVQAVCAFSGVQLGLLVTPELHRFDPSLWCWCHTVGPRPPTTQVGGQRRRPVSTVAPSRPESSR